MSIDRLLINPTHIMSSGRNFTEVSNNKLSSLTYINITHICTQVCRYVLYTDVHNYTTVYI